MIYCRFGGNLGGDMKSNYFNGCHNLADVKAQYEGLGYCIFHQVHDGALCFKNYDEYKKFLKSQKKENENE